MKALLVYPEHLPQTYWSFSGALPYIERRAALPPLGLVTVAAMLPEHWELRLIVTVAAMLPEHWELRLIDMNVAPLRDSDLLWADVVLTSTMVVQAPSLGEVVARCNRLGVPVAAGGPYPSISPERLNGVDHVFIGEAEGAIATFAEDLERGRAMPVYRAESFPDVDDSPVPRFDLLDLEAYASMAVQHSRGCPFSCEFCDIWKLYGRRHRVKSPDRMTAELD
ncbi:MAG: cobalamin-dependent protein, partial [Gemmatimonadales bacterium]